MGLRGFKPFTFAIHVNPLKFALAFQEICNGFYRRNNPHDPCCYSEREKPPDNSEGKQRKALGIVAQIKLVNTKNAKKQG